ncbi:MAG: nitroreductase [Oscillospiraceae bacterium]|nr:nitroreductase [Oscillospiraceae bacterium]
MDTTATVLQSLQTRRSVRSYLPKQVEETALEAVLTAGTWAPTGMNKQAPVIVAVQDAATVAKLSALNAAVMGSDKDPFYGAPTVLVVLADPSVRTWVEDGSLVMGNLMNAAHAVGLASCWIHRAREVFDSDEGKALLKQWGLPDTLRGVGNCILGYADGPLPDARPRKEGYIVRVK